MVCEDLIPEVGRRGLATFCDVFVDGLETAFKPEDARRVALAAEKARLKMRLHADQTSDVLHGAELAAELRVVSADHIDYSTMDGIRSMAAAGVVGVLLPARNTLPSLQRARQDRRHRWAADRPTPDR